ncbi:MAG: lasso peptide biosynthesis B2 protein [Terriglobia bacterium]
MKTSHGFLKLLKKWNAATWSDRAYLCEAVVFLAIATLAIRVLRFSFIARTAAWGGRGTNLDSDERCAISSRVRWAIMACACRVPWRAVCFQRGLAAQWMLRRRGTPSILYYGAAPNRESGLAAHVWVRDGDFDVSGGEGSERFAVLATFPEQLDR